MMSKAYIDCNLNECNTRTKTCNVRYLIKACVASNSYLLFQLNTHENGNNVNYEDPIPIEVDQHGITKTTQTILETIINERKLSQ